MIELTEDHDEMRAMALGERPFRVNALYERRGELEREVEPLLLAELEGGATAAEIAELRAEAQARIDEIFATATATARAFIA